MLFAINKEKEKYRQEMRRRLYAQSQQDRLRRSDHVFAQAEADPAFRESGYVMIYVSREEEVETRKLIDWALAKGKCVAVPCVDQVKNELMAVRISSFDEDLISGAYGIFEPKESIRRPFCPDNLDLVIVPGLAFDKANYRLGRGKGYYDRFLGKLSGRTRTWGFGFDFQVMDKIPRLRHDIQLNRVITN